MTPAQIELVQTSFATLAPRAGALAGAFYDRLFALDPALRPLFAADLRAQHAKLMAMLGAAVDGLHDLPALRAAVRALGARHAGYGVTDAHHASVGRALIDTLRAGLGAAFTSRHEQAWAAAYGALSAAMREGADATRRVAA